MLGVYSNDFSLGMGALEPSCPRHFLIQGPLMDHHVVAWLTGEEGEMFVITVTRLGLLKAGHAQCCLPRFAYGNTHVMVGMPADCGAVADRIVMAVPFCGRQY